MKARIPKDNSGDYSGTKSIHVSADASSHEIERKMKLVKRKLGPNSPEYKKLEQLLKNAQKREASDRTAVDDFKNGMIRVLFRKSYERLLNIREEEFTEEVFLATDVSILNMDFLVTFMAELQNFLLNIRPSDTPICIHKALINSTFSKARYNSNGHFYDVEGFNHIIGIMRQYFGDLREAQFMNPSMVGKLKAKLDTFVDRFAELNLEAAYKYYRTQIIVEISAMLQKNKICADGLSYLDFKDIVKLMFERLLARYNIDFDDRLIEMKENIYVLLSFYFDGTMDASKLSAGEFNKLRTQVKEKFEEAILFVYSQYRSVSDKKTIDDGWEKLVSLYHELIELFGIVKPTSIEEVRRLENELIFFDELKKRIIWYLKAVSIDECKAISIANSIIGDRNRLKNYNFIISEYIFNILKEEIKRRFGNIDCSMLRNRILNIVINNGEININDLVMYFLKNNLESILDANDYCYFLINQSTVNQIIEFYEYYGSEYSFRDIVDTCLEDDYRVNKELLDSICNYLRSDDIDLEKINESLNLFGDDKIVNVIEYLIRYVNRIDIENKSEVLDFLLNLIGNTGKEQDIDTLEDSVEYNDGAYIIPDLDGGLDRLKRGKYYDTLRCIVNYSIYSKFSRERYLNGVVEFGSYEKAPRLKEIKIPSDKLLLRGAYCQIYPGVTGITVFKRPTNDKEYNSTIDSVDSHWVLEQSEFEKSLADRMKYIYEHCLCALVRIYNEIHKILNCDSEYPRKLETDKMIILLEFKKFFQEINDYLNRPDISADDKSKLIEIRGWAKDLLKSITFVQLTDEEIRMITGDSSGMKNGNSSRKRKLKA